MSRSQEETVAKVVDATSSEGFPSGWIYGVSVGKKGKREGRKMNGSE